MDYLRDLLIDRIIKALKLERPLAIAIHVALVLLFAFVLVGYLTSPLPSTTVEAQSLGVCVGAWNILVAFFGIVAMLRDGNTEVGGKCVRIGANVTLWVLLWIFRDHIYPEQVLGISALIVTLVGTVMTLWCILTGSERTLDEQVILLFEACREKLGL